MTIRPDQGFDLPLLVRRSRIALEKEASALRGVVETITEDPQPGCPCLSDRAASAADKRAHWARDRLLAMTLRGGQLQYVNAYDHLASMARLLGSDGAMSLYAHTTLSRVICEAAVRLAWMFDHKISPEERLARGAGVLYASTADRIKGVDRAPTTLPAAVRESMLTESHGAQARLDAVIRDAGLELVCNRKGQVVKVRAPSAGATAPIKLDITAQMSARLPESSGWYGLSSGPTHSVTWTLESAVTSRPGEPLELSPDLLEVGAAAQSAISASALITTTFASYYGHDPAETARRSRSRRGIVDRLMRDYASPTSSDPA